MPSAKIEREVRAKNMKWLRKLGERMRVFMYGRYGFDELTMFLSVSALILAAVSAFFPPLALLAFLPLIWSIFRTYSRNIARRCAERDAYLKYLGKVKRYISLRRDMWRDRKTHVYFKCPVCRSYLRVPKGKGEITVTCPVCHSKTDRKT